jgi:hypothetical protein
MIETLQLDAALNELRKVSYFILLILTLQVPSTLILVHGAGTAQELELLLLNYGAQAVAEVYNAVVQQQAVFREIQALTVKSQ